MKAKLTIDGKEFEVEITEEQAKALTGTKKKTGYERVEKGETCYKLYGTGEVDKMSDSYSDWCNAIYESGNYYSDRTVAENNARADKLYRQLRRFAVEHREKEIDWNDERNKKWIIYYNHTGKILDSIYRSTSQFVNTIYFDTYEHAQLAIDTFKDELLWYFTEYKDSL